jgi:hypothetical protein
MGPALSTPVRRDTTDLGGLVVGWLVKLAAFLAVVGVFGFDGIAVLTARLGASDDADQAASVAATEYRTSHNVQAAYNAAVASLPQSSESIPASTFVVQSDGTVDLVVDRQVQTLVLYRIGPLKKFTVAREHGEGVPASL